MPYPFLLFDADHTLFDFDLAQRRALEGTLLELHGSFEPEHEMVYNEVNRSLWRAFERGALAQDEIKLRRFELTIEQLGLPLDPRSMNDLYLTLLAQGHFLLDGAQELVQALAADHTLVIVTNGLKEVQRPRIGASAIAEYFAGIVVSDEIGVAKPNRAIFDAAFRQLGDPDKQQVLMIGDSLASDMRGGIDYGIDTCWFNPHGSDNDLGLQVTYEVGSFAELERVLLGDEG